MTTRSRYVAPDDPEARAWPRLSRFYGLSIDELRATERSLTRIYIDELPRLQAEEQLRALEVSAYPHLNDENDQQEITHRWLRRADPGGEEPVETAPDGELPPAERLAGLGIQLVTEEAS